MAWRRNSRIRSGGRPWQDDKRTAGIFDTYITYYRFWLGSHFASQFGGRGWVHQLPSWPLAAMLREMFMQPRFGQVRRFLLCAVGGAGWCWVITRPAEELQEATAEWQNHFDHLMGLSLETFHVTKQLIVVPMKTYAAQNPLAIAMYRWPLAQIAKALRSTSIKHRFEVFVSDWSMSNNREMIRGSLL